MVVQTQTEELRRLRRTNLELIFSDHNAYCLPPCQNKCPSHIDIPGFLKANAEANWRESTRIFKRTIPFPSVLGRVCPAPCEEHCRRDEVDEAIAIRDSHRYAGDQVIRAMLDEDVDPPLPFERQAPSGRTRRGHRLRPGRHGRGLLPAARRPRRDGVRARPGARAACSATASRSTACPRSRSSRPSTSRSAASAARSCATRAWAATSRSTTSRTRASTRSSSRSAATTPTSWASRARTPTACIDGLEYLRTATLGLPYPGHEGKRVVVVGGGFTSMDCSRTSVRQGASEVTLVYRRDMKDMPAANEVHEAIEEGVTGHLPGRPDARHHRREDRQGHRRSSSSGWRWASPTRPAGAARSPRPAPSSSIDCDRVLLAIGQGPELDWIGPGSRRRRAPPSSGGSSADAVTFETGRPGVFGTGDVRIGAATVVQAIAEGRRAAYAVDAYLKGNDLVDDPRPARRSPSRSPSSSRSCRSRARSRSRATGSRRSRPRSRNNNYIEYEIPYTRGEAMAESTRCLQCTCEAIGFCDLRRLGIEYGTTLKTLEPQFHQGAGYRSVTENRFTGVNHDYIRDDSHAFILREPSRCIDCGRCANVCAEVVGAACYDFMRIGFDTLVTTPLDMSLNDTPCVSCGRCAETCPTGALMPKPRVLAEVRGRREPLHPVRHLRRRVPLRRRPRQRPVRAQPHVPRGADDRPPRPRRHRARHRDDATSARSATGPTRARARGPPRRPRAACCRCCRPSAATGNGSGNGRQRPRPGGGGRPRPRPLRGAA